MQLDDYIFDSQFLFLPQTEKLKRSYFDSVLSPSEHALMDGVEVFIRREDWDSKKLNKNISRLLWLSDKVSESNYRDIIKVLKQTDCCYVRLNRAHSFCKINHEFPALASKVSQHINLGEHDFMQDSMLNIVHYRESLAGDNNIIQQVLSLASTSFQYNRFRQDNHFSDAFINDMYSSWVQNEIKRTDTDLMLAMEKDKVAAFFLYRQNISPVSEYKIGFVSLIASSPEFKGKLYSSRLLNYGLHKAKNTGTQYCIANTEERNESALVFFRKNDFSITSYLNEYHIWN